MTTIKECTICSGHHATSREHCPFCGARPVYLANHSYERTCTRVTFRSAITNGVRAYELVRAYRSDIAFSITAQ